jgi:hypothetical protein
MTDNEFPVVQNPGLQFYVDRIERKEVYTFSRWGDGEWRAALQRSKSANCDRHRFFPDMNIALADILKSNPPYEMGIQRLALKCYGSSIRQFIQDHCSKINWYEADVFHKASMRGQAQPLFQVLKKTPLMMVGPDYLKKAKVWLQFEKFVSVPLVNCYRQLDRIYNQTLKMASDMPKPFVLSISASMPAEILIHRLYPHLKDSAFIIDFGSLYDPYVGRNTRQYHKDMTVETKARSMKGLQ